METVSMESDTGVNSSQNSEETQDELNNSAEDNNDATDISNHLRQFDVLDEVQGDDSGSENGDHEQRGKETGFWIIFAPNEWENQKFNWI